MILVVLASLGLAYAIYSQNKTHDSTIKILMAPKGTTQTSSTYRPFMGDVQFVTMKDRIYSSDITENHIERKPSTITSGFYGLTETQVRLNPADPVMVMYGPKVKLNI